MVTQVETPVLECEPPTMIPEADVGTLNRITHYPAKMLTLLGLATFPHGSYVPPSKLSERVNEWQGNEPVLDFTPLAGYYCRKSLEPSGLVERKSMQYKGKSHAHVRLADERAALGLAIVGAHLPLQADAPANSFLQKALGSHMPPAVEVNPRITIFEQLLSTDQPQTIMEMEQRSPHALRSTALQLATLGLLKSLDHGALANRVFEISGEPTIKFGSNPETVAALKAITALHRAGTTRASGTDILAMACQMYPQLRVEDMRAAFLAWASPNRGPRPGFVALNQVTHNKPTLTVQLEETLRPYVAKLLKIRKLLMDKEDAGKEFRLASWTAARQVIHACVHSPVATKGFLGIKPEGDLVIDRTHSDWRSRVDALIPQKGEVALSDLYHRFLRESGLFVSYNTFTTYLSESDEFVSWSRSQIDRRGQTRSVSRKPYFRRNWSDDASCRGEDPELFYPAGIQGPAVLQAKKAKSICASCPVRPACLKTALDHGLDYGIRGGYWLDIPKERAEAKKEALLQDVTIEGRKEPTKM